MVPLISFETAQVSAPASVCPVRPSHMHGIQAPLPDASSHADTGMRGLIIAVLVACLPAAEKPSTPQNEQLQRATFVNCKRMYCPLVKVTL